MTPKYFTPDALDALERAGFSRRDFLRGAGALLVGFSATGPLAPTANAQPFATIPLTQVDSWIAIAANENVIGYAGKCDFGQGFRTVQHQLIAEELSVPLERVSMLICDTAVTPDQGVSSGSQAHPTQFGNAALRTALATARDTLLRMAATQMNVAMDQLTVRDGVIFVNNDNNRRVSYGALVGGKKFAVALNPNAPLKDEKTYSILGTSVPRYDIPPKVTGEFQYVHHVRVPNMLHGRVVRPPMVGAKLVSVNQDSVKGMPGNVRVVTKQDFVGVVADNDWAAQQAALALDVSWTTPAPLPAQGSLYDFMRRQPSRDAFIVRAADVDEKLRSATRTVSATYLHPFQAHGSMGSACAVADFRAATNSITLWAASQGVYPLRDTAAAVLGLPQANVRVIFVEGSGCYGINAVDTVALDAGLLSQAVGRPVRVQLSRKDDLVAGENYGPAYVIDLKAGLDAAGNLQAWDYEAWTFSKGGRPTGASPANIPTGELAGFALAPFVPTTTPTVPTAFSNNSNAASAYGTGTVAGRSGGTGILSSERVLVHTLQSPLFTGPLRSPNRLQNTFANESFLDECAAAAKADPVQYRLRHLADQRLAECVRQAASSYGWDTRPSPLSTRGTGIAAGRGMACCLYEGNNGYCAMVALVEVNQTTGEIKVLRIVTSQDSGPISNPDGIKNQMEGGALQGMGRALYEEVRWSGARLTSIDWRAYKSYKFGDWVPEMISVPINVPGVEQMGAGECTITCAAAAIGNAVFDATGARLREVPFTPDRVLAALRAR
ncbi:MAG: molybdopterin-dependent oxidoreductase [Bryobacteraceae bacterium]|nr:molybdopterin-dependent oxidoreductase [Bryobacteraceae bacterium]